MPLHASYVVVVVGLVTLVIVVVVLFWESVSVLIVDGGKGFLEPCLRGGDTFGNSGNYTAAAGPARTELAA